MRNSHFGGASMRVAVCGGWPRVIGSLMRRAWSMPHGWGIRGRDALTLLLLSRSPMTIDETS